MWQAESADRRLYLCEDGVRRLDVALDHGGRYRVVVPDFALGQQIVAALERQAASGVLAAHGGLLGAKTVAENFALALHFSGASDEETQEDRERALHRALDLAGMPPARIAAIGRELPMNLNRRERWLLGFVRCLLRPPELLVLDRNLAGLTRHEAETLLAVTALYHDCHPFRPLLFVDLDTHELPPLGDCRAELRVAAPELEAA